MKKVFIFLSILFFIEQNIQCQTLEGITGLFFIPTADMQNDSKISIGASYLFKNIVSFGGFEYNAYSPYITINYLPFVEINLRLTRLIGLPPNNNEAIGDRTPNIRFRLFEEKKYWPTIVIGAHDLMTVFGGSEAVHNNSLYLVTTKHLLISSIINKTSISLGYGVNWQKAANHNFVGLFGGISFQFINTADLMTEYDGTHSNGGLRINLFNHIFLLGGFLQYKYFSGGAGFNFIL